MSQGPDGSDPHTANEAEEDGYAAEARQRIGMHVPFAGRGSYPSVRIGKISHVPGQNERGQQTGKEQTQANEGQLRTSADCLTANCDAFHSGTSIAAA